MIPLFGFIHGMAFLIFLLVLMSFMKQATHYFFIGLGMLDRELQDRHMDRIHQQRQRERALEQLYQIRQNYER